MEAITADQWNARKKGKGKKPGKGRTRNRTDGMNKLEAKYDKALEADPTVLWHYYEPGSIRLAKRTYYKPDFKVQRKNGDMEYHEVKGFWEDDARVKIKVAAEIHPERFIAVQWKKDKATGVAGWQYEVIGGEA